MSVLAIAQGRVNDRALMDEYVALAIPTVEAHDGKVLAFDEAPTLIEGTTDYPRTVVLEFESEQAFYRWYDSPEYRAARPLREKAAEGTFTLVQGLA